MFPAPGLLPHLAALPGVRGHIGAAGQAHAENIVGDERGGRKIRAEGVGGQIGPFHLQKVVPPGCQRRGQGPVHGGLIPGGDVRRPALSPGFRIVSCHGQRVPARVAQ